MNKSTPDLGCSPVACLMLVLVYLIGAASGMLAAWALSSL
jgi:hypothetical protein